VLAANLGADRWFGVALGAAVVSTWVMTIEGEDAAGDDGFNLGRAWTAMRFQVWLYLGGAVPSAMFALRADGDSGRDERDAADRPTGR